MKQPYLLIGAAMLFLSTGCSAANRSDEAGTKTEAAQTDAANEITKDETGVASAPALADGYDWAIRINKVDRGLDATLAYEMEDTDDQPLYFICEEGGQSIFAGVVGGAANLRTITIVSGDSTLQLGGRTEATEIAEMPSFTSEEIASGSPFIRAFLTNGWLRMTADGTTIDMAATDSGKKAIERFVKFCAG